MRPLTRLAALLVVLGILAPQGSALLAAAGLADGRVLVICTGDGLRTLRIGADGAPVEVSDRATYCALVHAIDTGAGVAPAPAPRRIVHALARPLAAFPARAARTARPSLPRAPPAA